MNPLHNRRERMVRSGVLAALVVVLAGCGPFPEQDATPTAPVWTDTPVPTETATPTPLTTLSTEASPTEVPIIEIFYQSADLIVYRYDDQICIGQGSGQARLLISARNVANVLVSADQKLIVFLRAHVVTTDGLKIFWDELWRIQPDGSGETSLLDLAQVAGLSESIRSTTGTYLVHPIDIQWAGDSHRLVFTSGKIDLDQEWFGRTDESLNDLHSIDADTGRFHTLLSPGYGGSAVFPSPDGQTIALITHGKFEVTPSEIAAKVLSPESISLVNTNGDNLRWGVLTYDATIIPHNDGHHILDPEIVWAPDSSGIRIAIFTKNPITDTGEATMDGWFIPLHGTAIPAYKLEGLRFWESTIVAPFPSPDGRYIAGYMEIDGDGGLHIIDTVTQQHTLYAQGLFLRFVHWEPDSRHFIFRVTDESFVEHLMQGNIGGQAEEVSRPTLSSCAP